MGFGALRVLNDDIIDPGGGFDMHPHSNMEIVTIVLDGELEHKDNMGNSGIINLGEIQHMSAGSGVVHSEYNPSKIKPAAILQIWVLPKEKNITPSYDQKKFSEKEMKNKFLKVVSGEKNSTSLYMHQQGAFYLGEFEKGKKVVQKISKGMGAYLFVIKGSAEVDSQTLNERDAAEITSTEDFEIRAKSDSKILIIEISMK